MRFAWVCVISVVAACGDDGGGSSPDGGGGNGDGGVDAPGDGSVQPIEGLDPSFGTGGRVVGAFAGGHDYLECLAVQSTGAVVALSKNSFTSRDAVAPEATLVVQRFDPDGNKDMTFGVAGHGTWTRGRDMNQRDCVVTADDKIVLVGTIVPFDSFTASGFVARYTATGQLDTSFGGTGFIVEPEWNPTGVAVQADGKIVIAGRRNNAARFIVDRFGADGARDAAFGTNGTLAIGDASFFGTSWDVIVQDDGKLVVTGSATRATAVRLLPDGTLDPAFGGGTGIVKHPSTAFTGDSSTAGIDAAGNIVLFMPATTSNSYYIRFTASGTVDMAFGGANGVLTGGQFDQHMRVQPDGKLVAVRYNSSVGRYLPTGAPDPAFSDDGNVDASFSIRGRPTAMALVGDGVLVGGYDAEMAFTYNFVRVNRFTADGMHRSTSQAAAGVGREAIGAFDIDANGTIHVFGLVEQFWHAGFLARFGVDGALEAGPLEDYPQAQELAGFARQSTGRYLAGDASDNEWELHAWTADLGRDRDFPDTIRLDGYSQQGMRTLLRLPDDSIVLGGRLDGGMGFLKLQPDGERDTTFGTQGIRQLDTDAMATEIVYALAVRSDGKLLAAARHGNAGYVLAQLDATGAPDATFTSVPQSFTGQQLFLHDVLPTSDGGAIVVATLHEQIVTTTMIVARHRADGSLDTSFGDAGFVKTAVPVQTPVRGVLLPTGQLLLVRSVAVDAYELDVLVSRHDPATGAVAEERRFDLGPGNDSPLAVAMQPSGKILVGGRTWQPQTGADYFVFRLP